MQNEGLTIGDDDLVTHHPIDGIRHLFLGTAQVDECGRVRLKHPKLVTQQHIHADATDALLTRLSMMIRLARYFSMSLSQRRILSDAALNARFLAFAVW